MSTLHCGACQRPMPDEGELTRHLKTCPAAAVLFLPTVGLMLGMPDPSHKAGRLVMLMVKYAHSIREYAFAVANELDSYLRSSIHLRMCEKLGLEYSDFQPFEAGDIHEVPTVDQAEEIIYRALAVRLQEFINQGK